MTQRDPVRMPSSPLPAPDIGAALAGLVRLLARQAAREAMAAAGAEEDHADGQD